MEWHRYARSSLVLLVVRQAASSTTPAAGLMDRIVLYLLAALTGSLIGWTCGEAYGVAGILVAAVIAVLGIAQATLAYQIDHRGGRGG